MIDPDELHATEQALIGDCLLVPAQVREAAGIVAPADFADIRLGAVFGLICAMVSAHGPESVSPVSVVQEITQRRAAERAETGKRGFTAYPKAEDLYPLISHGRGGTVTIHARIVREEAVLRDLAAFGRRTIQAAEVGEAPAGLAARVTEEAKAIRDGYRTSTVTGRLLADILDDSALGEYDWVIPGLLERNDRLVVTGAEGRGKTTFLRQIAMCAAAGIQPFSASRYDPVRVAIIDAENSERQWHRKTSPLNSAIKRIAGVNPAERIQLACVPRQDVTSANTIGMLHAFLDDHEPDLLIIGPLYKMVPGALQNDTDAAPLINALDGIRERGITLLMEAHAGHAQGKGGERDYRPRGSSALLGWPEFGFGLAPDEDDPSIAHVIRWRGDRDERNWPNRLRRGGVMPWTDDSIEPGKESGNPGDFSADAIQNRRGAA